jgi:predicted DNA-binding protein (UPF0251 family)
VTGALRSRRLVRATARIERLSEELEAARPEWAAFVRQVGISAAAEHMGMSRQAISHRVRAIERRGKV